MTVTPQIVDFSHTPERSQSSSGKLGVRNTPITVRSQGSATAPRTPDGKVLTAKQIRARARRRAKRAEIMTDDEFNAIYKPIEEWDLDELARGRPRGTNGKFGGPTPKWITREVHERSMDRFKAVIKGEMQGQTPGALDALRWIIENDERDEKEKPIVPASTKLDAAKFLLEHVVGKPTQRIESDVSVKLQAILGQVMVNPAEALGAGYTVGHLPGVTMPMATQQQITDAGNWEEADVVEDEDSDLDINFN